MFPFLPQDIPSSQERNSSCCDGPHLIKGVTKLRPVGGRFPCNVWVPGMYPGKDMALSRETDRRKGDPLLLSYPPASSPDAATEEGSALEEPVLKVST